MMGEHTIRRAGFEIVYWKGSTACGHLNAWDHAVITVYHGTYRTEFNVNTKYDLDKLCTIMDRVFVAGMKEKAARIREVLEIEQ